MRKLFVTAAVLGVLVSACVSQTPERTESAPQRPANFPEEYYRLALQRGMPVFRVDPALSLVVIEVRRGGSLARLGHDHVVASHDVQGYVATEDARADLYVQLDRLVVDEPELRAEAGFDTQLSETFIAGTRQNMLEKVLEAKQYPYALINVSRGSADTEETKVSITLHGTTHALQVPLKIENRAEGLAVSGTAALNQSDFGIAPFSILGGAITVQDQVNLRFRILAQRVAAPAPSAASSDRKSE
jgi:hypothetical protein